MVSHAEPLAAAELFAPLDRIALARLASCVEPFAVQAGEVVIRQGDAGMDLFIVARGRFGVFAHEPDDTIGTRLDTLGPGSCFGEMSLLTGEPRAATVRADADGELLRLERDRFLDLVRSEPEVGLAVAGTVSRRLRRTDRAVQDQGQILARLADRASAPVAAVRASEAGGPALLDVVLPPADELSARHRSRRQRLACDTKAAEPRFPAGHASQAAGTDQSDNVLVLRGRRDRGPAGASAIGSARHAERARGLDAMAGVVAAALLVTIGLFGGSGPQAAFVLFLAAGVLLWVCELASAAAISLGLVALWTLSGIATPSEAIAGFGSTGWLFAVAVLGLAQAADRSGLLLRLGLLIIQRAPPTLLGTAGALLLTGVALSPLLPTGIGRAAITAPLALAAADAMRLRRCEPAAAVLGMAAWIGAGPLLFVFLNGSPVCLLAWGLLPESSRVRFDWTHWLLAALPLGIVIGVGSLAALFAVMKPEHRTPVSRERLRLQLAVLGQPSTREVAMATVLALTVAGWAVGPTLGIDASIVAILGLLGAVLTGSFTARSLSELDWDYLIFYGVALSLVRVMALLGVDQLVAETIGEHGLRFGFTPPLFILTVAVLTMLARLVLLPEPAVLLLSLAFIPVAPAVGVDPWIAVITILATGFFWFLPSQTPSYLASQSASEGRLYSPGQARCASLAYAVVTLAALALTLPYWAVLGLV
jgi:CRP-like cAMP-binding protein/di/tricarboxylate transporter